MSSYRLRNGDHGRVESFSSDPTHYENVSDGSELFGMNDCIHWVKQLDGTWVRNEITVPQLDMDE